MPQFDWEYNLLIACSLALVVLGLLYDSGSRALIAVGSELLGGLRHEHVGAALDGCKSALPPKTDIGRKGRQVR